MVVYEKSEAGFIDFQVMRQVKTLFCYGYSPQLITSITDFYLLGFTIVQSKEIPFNLLSDQSIFCKIFAPNPYCLVHERFVQIYPNDRSCLDLLSQDSYMYCRILPKFWGGVVLVVPVIFLSVLT